MSIKVTDTWAEQNQLVSHSAKEIQKFCEFLWNTLWSDMGISTTLRRKKRVYVQPQSQGFLCCRRKRSLAVLNGKGEQIPAGGKAGRRAASQGTASGYQQALLWLLTCCQKCELLLGLLKWEKIEWGSFWTYWKLLRPSSFIILLSCWSRMLMVWPDLQDQANWGRLLRTFKRTYISLCIWT